MDLRPPPSTSRLRVAQAAALTAATLAAAAQAQTPASDADTLRWQSCAALAQDADARLACYDRWATQQDAGAPASATESPEPPMPALASGQPAAAAQAAPEAVAAAAPPQLPGCHDSRHSELARYWELERSASCPSLSIRGYRPISLSVITSNRVATQPTSPNPLNNATTEQPYQKTEMRLQLSVRTKLMRSIFTASQDEASDSLWFGYTSQSYWQLFNPGLSRPFRNTDHEPEFLYVYPTDAQLPGGWRWRMSGAGVSHQSNGQTLPLSRSWNRFYLITGMEHGRNVQLTAKVWSRMPETPADDDNPDIADHVGRGELIAHWRVGASDTLGMSLRHSLHSRGRGSVRLEWLSAIGEPGSALRLHTQLFSGYGDSLLDYNRRRTVLSLGLSLVDF